MPRLESAWLNNAYDAYTTWLWEEFGYSKNWIRHFPEMSLYYSIAGIGRAPVAEFALAAVRRSHTYPRFQDSERNSVKLARPRWGAGKILATELCRAQGTNPVSWFTDTTALHCRWAYLQKSYGTRAKVASFIMRDLSFLRDFSDGAAGPATRYTNTRGREWFDRLSLEDQALFIPIDFWVHHYAREYGASTICAQCPPAKIKKLQDDAEVHRKAGIEIARWARRHDYDPREVDVYWYQRGAGDIDEEGRPRE